jgi:excisionase family DNA binding protein
MSTVHKGQYYTVSDAARVLDVSPSTVWRWIAAGKLPAYRIGGKSIRIRKDDLQAIIHPARVEVTTRNQEHPLNPPPTQEELARRQALVAQILARRKERVIAPLTSTDLVQMVRETGRRAYGTDR